MKNKSTPPKINQNPTAPSNTPKRPPTQKRLVITRPIGMNDSSTAFFTQQGFSVRSLPLIRLNPKRELYWHQIMMEIDDYHYLVVTSPMAALFFVKAIQRVWSEIPPLRYFAIGENTALALAELSTTVGYPPSEAGEAIANSSERFLAYFLPETTADEKVLIVGGDEPRALISKTLQENGLQVDHLSLYTRESVIYEPTLLQDALLAPSDQSVCILTTSGDIVLSLQHNIAQSPTLATAVKKNAILLVPSERVAGIARELGFAQVYNANSASNEGLLSWLRG